MDSKQVTIPPRCASVKTQMEISGDRTPGVWPAYGGGLPRCARNCLFQIDRVGLRWTPPRCPASGNWLRFARKPRGPPFHPASPANWLRFAQLFSARVAGGPQTRNSAFGDPDLKAEGLGDGLTGPSVGNWLCFAGSIPAGPLCEIGFVLHICHRQIGFVSTTAYRLPTTDYRSLASFRTFDPTKLGSFCAFAPSSLVPRASPLPA